MYSHDGRDLRDQSCGGDLLQRQTLRLDHDRQPRSTATDRSVWTIGEIERSCASHAPSAPDSEGTWIFAKILWIPGHKGIVGNERAHQAAQETTAIGKWPTTDLARRVREHRAVSKLLVKAVEAGTPEATITWGRYTYTLDGALPGKHTLQLYGPLSREDAGILAQARTGHTHLNEYRARIKQAESALCDCDGGVESVKHVILQCPTWTTARQRLREAAGDRWGMFPFCLEGRVGNRTQ